MLARLIWRITIKLAVSKKLLFKCKIMNADSKAQVQATFRGLGDRRGATAPFPPKGLYVRMFILNNTH
jgi:hypothetical protein